MLENSRAIDNNVKKIRSFVDDVLFAPTKAAAKTHLRKLESEVSILTVSLQPYAREKLRQVVTYSSEASGQVKNKEHWIRCTEQAWYLFEREIKKQPDTIPDL